MRRVLLVVLLLTVVVANANAMRCSRQLIRVGDYVSKMFTNCGKPVFSIDLSTAFVNKQQHSYQMNGRTKIITVLDGKIVSIRTE